MIVQFIKAVLQGVFQSIAGLQQPCLVSTFCTNGCEIEKGSNRLTIIE